MTEQRMQYHIGTLAANKAMRSASESTEVASMLAVSLSGLALPRTGVPRLVWCQVCRRHRMSSPRDKRPAFHGGNRDVPRSISTL
jgi:hypothetical protein